MPPVGFKPTIPVSERPQTDVLDRAVTAIGIRSPDRPARSESLYRLSYRGIGVAFESNCSVSETKNASPQQGHTPVFLSLKYLIV